MKTSLYAIALQCVCVGSLSAASPSVWNSDGSGSWSDESRWKDGNVPQSGYQVRLTGTTYANDEDMPLLAAAGTIVLPDYSSVFTISNDVDAVLRNQFYGEGKVVKLGKGSLTLDWAGDKTKIANLGMWEVRDGVLFEVSTDIMQPKNKLAVYDPGVLVISNDVKVIGLVGDGIISNASPVVRTIFVIDGTRENPSEFSGMFAGEAKIAYKDEGGGQRLTNPDVFDSISSIEMKKEESADPGYLGFVTAPTVDTVGRVPFVFEYLGSGGSGSSNKIFFNNAARCVEYDSGPNGGFTLNNVFTVPSDQTGVIELILSGSNTVASAFNGTFSGMGTKVKAAYIKKTGTGTWNFIPASLSNFGTVEVEKGTLGYSSIAERGTQCSLGSATCTQSEYTGAYDETKTVPYAYLLGDGTVPNGVDETVATMNYTGSNGAFITNRAVVLDGAGRFSSDSAMLNWCGFTSAADTRNLLILGGSAVGCVARGVTNGVGTLSVAKEGSGSWTLAGDIDFTGSLEARAGKLNVSQRYHWYKIIFKETWKIPSGGTDDYLMLGGIGLFAEDGDVSYTNLAWNASADGNPSTLMPGEVCLARSGYSTQSGREPVYFFRDNHLAQVGYKKTLVLDDDSTWIEFVVRLPEDAEPITRYNLRAWSGMSSGGKPYFREAYSWSIQGSSDGVEWDELHTVISNKTLSGDAAAIYSQKKWYSADSDSAPVGWAIATRPQSAAKLTTVSAVGAGAGARLFTDTPITANGIIYDAALGGGTVDGFTFGDSPVINVRNLENDRDPVSLPIVFTNVTSLANLGGAPVTFDGVASTWRTSVSNGMLKISPPGTVVLIR